ncbi:hypothetical protein ACRAWF_11205 [Streptomyces sp. L7]
MARAVAAKMDDQTQGLLDLAYQSALGQAFLVDDLSDGQVANDDVKLLPVLKEIEVAIAVEALGWPDARVAYEWSSHQAQALESELESYATLRGFADSTNIVGRSAPVISYFEAITRHGSALYVEPLRPLLIRYLVVAQRCDDLSDWESDLLQGRYTPTVQVMLEQAGISAAEYDESFFPEMLRAVYLDGILLNGLEDCNRELREIVHEIKKIPSATETLVCIVSHLNQIVEGNIEKVRQLQ